VSERIARPQKESTIQVYEGKWQSFCNWCSRKSLNPFETDVVTFSEFLCWLKEEKNLAVSTIEGYRTAVASTLRGHTGIDLGKDQDLSNLLANFAKERPKKRTASPAWDL
jgi:site-specific recombinase XerD